MDGSEEQNTRTEAGRGRKPVGEKLSPENEKEKVTTELDNSHMNLDGKEWRNFGHRRKSIRRERNQFRRRDAKCIEELPCLKRVKILGTWDEESAREKRGNESHSKKPGRGGPI